MTPTFYVIYLLFCKSFSIDRVEVNYFGTGSWYPATITAVNATGDGYTVTFDGEDAEKQDVFAADMRGIDECPAASSISSSSSLSFSSSLLRKFVVGGPCALIFVQISVIRLRILIDIFIICPRCYSSHCADRVEVNYFGTGSWYPATITTVNANGDGYTVTYDGEDAEKQDVTAADMKALDATSKRSDGEAAEDTEGDNSTPLSPSGGGGESAVASSTELGDESSRLELHELYAALGGLYGMGADGIPKDTEAAYDYYSKAAQEAMKLGKTAMAMKYSDMATEFDL